MSVRTCEIINFSLHSVSGSCLLKLPQKFKSGTSFAFTKPSSNLIFQSKVIFIRNPTGDRFALLRSDKQHIRGWFSVPLWAQRFLTSDVSARATDRPWLTVTCKEREGWMAFHQSSAKKQSLAGGSAQRRPSPTGTWQLPRAGRDPASATVLLSGEIPLTQNWFLKMKWNPESWQKQWCITDVTYLWACYVPGKGTSKAQ